MAAKLERIGSVNEPANTPTVELGPADPSGSLTVDLDSFVDFALQFDMELEALVEKFSPRAAPAALRAWRR